MRRSEHGMTAVEFVLVTPVLIVAFLFVVGLSRMAYASQQVEDVAGQAARAASLERNTVVAAARGREMAIQSLGQKGLSCASLDVSIDVSNYEPGGVVRARVTCTTRLGDVALSGLGGQRTFISEATVPIERYRSR